ncbi:MAG: hypothetical protein K9N55_10900 [Phycisphaerae bacterium]|nr:hypothetical protein [Phycisphaerae bacterium]
MNEPCITSDVCLGIIKEGMRLHEHYIEACRDLGVPYKVLDISGPNWMDVIDHSLCDAFLVSPFGDMRAWRQLYDERLRLVTQEFGKTLFPSYDELWVCENKRRLQFWLEAKRISHQRSWVYYDRQDAVAFADATPLPVVCQVDCGAGNTDVQIFRERGKLIRWVNRSLKNGTVKLGGDAHGRQWGNVLFQTYMANATAWRVIRIGQSYIGSQKIRLGDIVGESKQLEPGWPPDALLEFVKTVTDCGGFKSVVLDIFETQDGRYLVNDLKTAFGPEVEDSLPMAGTKPGRFVFDDTLRTWRFEEGLFCQNRLCNLYVQTLLEQLGAASSHQDSQADGGSLDEI